ncbi:uncharacterized [Tachysurus ichikawai]
MRLAGCAGACVAKLSRKQQHANNGARAMCDTPKEDLVPCLQTTKGTVIIRCSETSPLLLEAARPALTKLPIVGHNLIYKKLRLKSGRREVSK